MKRSILDFDLRPSVLCFALAICSAGIPSAIAAQTTGVTQITGTVLDVHQQPVADAQVHLLGPVSQTASTATNGTFTFLNLPVGLYRLDISKGGFSTLTQDDIATSAGATTNLSFSMQAASLTSLTEIGHVAVSTRNGANAMNTTPASIVDVPATTFAEQGQLSVNQVLNEEPGITIGQGNGGLTTGCAINGASPLAIGVPSIRGGLPYETESLIDGHPISLGQLGFFSPSFISPYLLQNVEVVKGPGATSPSINYAINGTINYRTLEPTLKPEESVDFGEDQYGGNFANFRLTGTLPNGKLSYAFDYVTQGTQGFTHGFTGPSIFFPEGATYLNGSRINPYGIYGVTGGPANVAGSYELYDGLLMCCPATPTNSNERNELGKIRYAFSPSTTLTITWLGGQVIGSYYDALGFPCANVNFAPPAGYSGSLPAGAVPLAFVPQYNGWLDTQDTNLFETEFHTPLGKMATLQLRQYSSSIQTFIGGPGDSGPTAAGTSVTGGIYGGVVYTSSPTPVIFDGELGTIDMPGGSEYKEHRSYNDLNGYTVEIDKQAGSDLLTLSYDDEKTSTYAEQNCYGAHAITVPSGSSQSFQSIMGRAEFDLGDRVNGTLSDNFGSYTDVYTQNGGVTFQQATHTYEAPRLSLTWRPSSNQSVRAAIGTSIAPPYIALLNNDAVISPGVGVPPPYYTETVNSGDVLPETAFGFDIGLDTRLHSPYTVLSVDAYQTILHNQFLQTTSQQGTYTCLITAICPGAAYGTSAPLYVTKTANLGHSEYEGIELSLHRTPPIGWGYRIQGSLQRAFAYDLPAGFYTTPAGPDTANLGVLPNINFQSSGGGYNGMSSSRVPYSTGYGEVNYRGRNGAYFLAGITYYGPNNSYDEPAFEVVTTSFTQPLNSRASLELSIYNLTNAYPNPYFQIDYAGTGSSPIYTPLVNGQVGSVAANMLGPSTARLVLHVAF